MITILIYILKMYLAINVSLIIVLPISYHDKGGFNKLLDNLGQYLTEDYWQDSKEDKIYFIMSLPTVLFYNLVRVFLRK